MKDCRKPLAPEDSAYYSAEIYGLDSREFICTAKSLKGQKGCSFAYFFLFVEGECEDEADEDCQCIYKRDELSRQDKDRLRASGYCVRPSGEGIGA
jgi:hypothetical protein